jgi:8-oxo-dGTP pyrophosphatase MutT (NUDIX family)
LWKDLWQISDCHSFQREYNDAKAKFNLLKSGFLMKNPENNEMFFFDVEYLVNNTHVLLQETEWGFPKGRRNINEDDYTCAVREFKEETGISNKNLLMFRDIKPFEEVFSGSNHVRYKHTYYLGMFSDGTCHIVKNKNLCKEIKDIKWFWYSDAQNRIRDNNVERKELFKRVNTTILKNICSFINNG